MQGDVQVNVEIIDSMDRDDLLVTPSIALNVMPVLVSLKSVDFSWPDTIQPLHRATLARCFIARSFHSSSSSHRIHAVFTRTLVYKHLDRVCDDIQAPNPRRLSGRPATSIVRIGSPRLNHRSCRIFTSIVFTAVALALESCVALETVWKRVQRSKNHGYGDRICRSSARTGRKTAAKAWEWGRMGLQPYYWECCEIIFNIIRHACQKLNNVVSLFLIYFFTAVLNFGLTTVAAISCYKTCRG